ncbi:MAG: glycosyltransferase [Saprospiraceae bacterium]
MKNVTIYIISYNRLTTLKESIHSYLKFSDYRDIVILDNGSDYPPLLQYLRDLSQLGTMVEYLPKVYTREERGKLNKVIARENELRNNDYYVVTDPDIAFLNPPKNILKTYILLLENLDVDVVGPMLSIIDIPKGYPGREYAWKLHVQQFWHRNPSKIKLNNENVFYLLHKIDTTFGVFKSSYSWKRQSKGARIYAPYEAKHLDWYFTIDNLPEDQKYYSECVKNVAMSHWSGRYLINEPFNYLPNFRKKIKVVTKNGVEDYSLPKNRAYHRQIISTLSFFIEKLFWIRS